MPTYRTTLPALSKHQGFDLKRTPEVGSLEAVITCDNLLVCDTHFFHGRTTPCERTINIEGKTIDDTLCMACVEKIAYRTHAYVSAFHVKKSEHFIFECTANAAKALEEYRKATGTLRGCWFHSSRPKGLKNSKVVIETNTANLGKIKIPNPPDMIRALAVIWRLPVVAIEVEPDGKKNGKVKLNNNRIKNMTKQPDNMADPSTIGDLVKDLGF